MKILMVNFLRLGDILMSCPIVDQIRRQNPNHEIHYLIFEEFKVASQVFSDVQWHYLSRARLRQCMESLDEGLLAPIDDLHDFIEGLSSLGFDQVISLSHTVATTHFLSLIRAPQKLGTYIENATLKYSSSGFEILDRADERVRDSKHYLDWYRSALGLSSSPVTWNFRSTSVHAARKRVVLQALSSDEKKAWSIESWKDLCRQIQFRDPEMDVVFLCAPPEEKELRLLLGPGFQVQALSLSAALDLLHKSQFLITLDTSISHLANATQIQVIELFFGNANWQKQAIYKENSILVVPQAPCYPCGNEVPCPKVQRECALQVKPIQIADLIFGKAVQSRSFSIYKTEHIGGQWKVKGAATAEITEEKYEERTKTREGHSEA